MTKKLTMQELEAAMAKGDFEAPEGDAGAIILTQSWCPQWKAMKKYLVEVPASVCILWTEYDLESCFDRFMKFKEETYKNHEIPYVRYFRKGIHSSESNYVSFEGFLHRLGTR